MARKLRIATSVFFGLLTVALCVLWVRINYAYRVVYIRFVGAHRQYDRIDVSKI